MDNVLQPIWFGFGSAWHKRYVLIFVLSFLLFHSIYPMRHFFLYKSNPSWTEEGHTGASSIENSEKDPS